MWRPLGPLLQVISEILLEKQQDKYNFLAHSNSKRFKHFLAKNLNQDLALKKKILKTKTNLRYVQQKTSKGKKKWKENKWTKILEQ